MTDMNETASYPEPGPSHLNPYPVLADNSNYNDADLGSEDIQLSDEPAYPQTADETSLDTYQVLAEKFRSHSTNQSNGASWRFPGQDGVGYGPPDTTPRKWTFQDAFGPVGGTDDDPEVGVLGRPRENAFLQPMRNAERSAGNGDSEMPDASSMTEGEDGPSRGRGRGRRRGRGRGRGRATSKAERKRGWKQLLKGTTHDPALNKDDPKRARGTGRRARGRVRAEKRFDPGREFKDHLQTANQAYLRGDYEEATEHAILAVQANPEVFQAHNLLSDSLEKLGRTQDAVAALMCGAYTTKDPNVWILVGDRTLAYAGEQRSDEDIDQALFCYSTAVKMQPELYDARASRLALLIEKEDWSKARLEAKAMHKLRPTDIDIKKTYAELCVMTEESSEMVRAKDAYEIAFSARMETDLTEDEIPDHWSHLNVYLDLVDRVGTPEEGIGQLKLLARWILGRKVETVWDHYTENDCEFDTSQDRRAYVPEFQQGHVSLDRSKYGDGLPLELRVKFGVFRMKMGEEHFDEALRHFSLLNTLVTEIDDYYDMFFQVAETLKNYSKFTHAIEYYQPILRVPDIANVELYMALGACYMAVESHQEAIDCFKAALELDKSDREIRFELMKAYSQTGQHDAALQVFPEVPATGQEEFASSSAQGSSSEESFSGEDTRKRAPRAPRRTRTRTALRQILPNPAQKPTRTPGTKQRYSTATVLWRRVKEQETEAFRLYTELKHLWPFMAANPEDMFLVKQWSSVASQLLFLFREMPIFYPKREQYYANRGMGPLDSSSAQLQRDMQNLRTKLERHAARVNGDDNENDEGDDHVAPPQLNDAMPSDFLNISFTEWHRVFVEYALLTARHGQQQISYDTVQKGLFKANVFYYNQSLHNTSIATAICVATMYNDSRWLHTLARRFITSGDYYAGMTFQLTAGLARLTYGPNYYSSGPSQKFMLRMVKIHDGLGMTEEMRNGIEFGNVKRAIETRIEKYGDERELDPGLLMLYGHQVSAVTQSYSAIPYYMRALALQPESVCALLSMTVVQIQNAMKRQTDNRHYGITMGLAFLARYCHVRQATGRVSHLQETKYNEGRIWHTLGLTDLAIPCYEEALELSEMVRLELAGVDGDADAVEDFAIEAAFALRNIYAVTGNQEEAMRITEQWLVI